MLTLAVWICVAVAAALCFAAADARLARGWNALPCVARASERLANVLRRETMLATAILCIGVALRCWQMLRTRQDILPDELWTMLEARSLWQTGKSLEGQQWPVMLPGWMGEGNGPLLAWIAMVPLAVFGRTVLALRLPMLVLQVLSMGALWDMIRRAFSGKAALWALFLVAVSPWHILQSGWALSWQLFPHLMLLVVWMCTQTRRRAVWFAATIAMLGLAMYTCDAAWYVVPVFVLLMCACLLRFGLLRWRVVAPGILMFALMACPALYACGVQNGVLPERTVFGLEAANMEDAPHAQDWIVQTPKRVTSSYAADPYMPPQESYGLQWIPFLRNDPYVASLHTDLLSSTYHALKSTLLQFVYDAGYTRAYFLQDFGYLYMLSIPLMLLGVLLCIARRNKKLQARPRHVFTALLGAWVVAAGIFMLTHLQLSLTHYAVLFYPMVLCAAYGIVYVTRKLRLSTVALVVLYGANLCAFLLMYNPAPAYPGMQQAMAYAAQQQSMRVIVTTRLYPHETPQEAAALQAMWAYDLPAAYVRGELVLDGELPYGERFAYAYVPALSIEPSADAVYIVHETETGGFDGSLFESARFGEFSVLQPRP